METVLLVDDDELFRWALKDAFEDAGYAIHEAQDCAGARASLTSGIDVALLDQQLPDGTGFHLLRYIRESNLACLALVLTAYPTDEGERKARMGGAYTYLQKPDAPQKVVELVGLALRLRRPL